MLLLAALHIVIGRRLRWAEDCKRLAPVNEAIFHVHTLFICLVLVLMGLPCIFQPAVFLEPTAAGAWMAWSGTVFWAVRLYCQWFVYPSHLWRGKRAETAVHRVCTILWAGLTALFSACGAVQAGWL